MNKPVMRCIVSGRVQGVWFRDSTRQQAERLQLSGSAINLPDGNVEVIACGEEVALQQLKEWLWHGPELARVTDVSCESIRQQPPSGYTTR